MLLLLQVTDQITGSFNAQLPWECEERKPSILKELGVLADPVMAMLKRDPAERMSVAEFCGACAELLGLPAPLIGTAAEDAGAEPPAGLAAVS